MILNLDNITSHEWMDPKVNINHPGLVIFQKAVPTMCSQSTVTQQPKKHLTRNILFPVPLTKMERFLQSMTIKTMLFEYHFMRKPCLLKWLLWFLLSWKKEKELLTFLDALEKMHYGADVCSEIIFVTITERKVTKLSTNCTAKEYARQFLYFLIIDMGWRFWDYE